MPRDDFEIRFTDTTQYSGVCFNCNESIDRTDGPKFVKVSVPNQEELKFHHDCYLYFLSALIKFREVFMDEQEEVSEVYLH